MFSLILKNCGFRRTFQPLLVQTREFKREVVPSDLDIEHPDNPFNTINGENDEHIYEEKNKDKGPKLWVNNNFGLDIPDKTYIH